MKKEKTVKKHIVIIFIAVTIVQILTIVFWASRKSNFYWDEFYTLQRAHYMSATTPEDHYINNDPNYETGKWLPVSIIKDTLVVNKEESVLHDPLIRTVKKLFEADNYCIFLNIINTFIFEGELSIWPSVILNIIIFVINQIVLYLLCKEISEEKYFPIVVTSLYGFTSMCISMTVFVRFYMWATLLTTLFTYFHFLFFKAKENEYIKKILCMIISFVIFYIDYKSAQFCVFYGVFFIATFSVMLLVNRRIKDFVLYIVPIIIGGTVYLTVINRELLWSITHLREASESGEALGWATGQIVNFKKRYLPERIIEMGGNFGTYIFGSIVVMGLFFLFCLICFVLKTVKQNKNEEKTKKSVNKKMIILLITLVLYFGFFTAFKLYEQIRYVSYVFPEACVIVIAILFYTVNNKKIRYFASVVLILSVIAFVTAGRKVDFLFENYKQIINTIKAQNINSIVLCTDYMPTMISYQPAVYMEDDAEFFVFNLEYPEEVYNLMDDRREEMLVMSYTGLNKDDVLNLLYDNGYQITELYRLGQYTFNKAVLID